MQVGEWGIRVQASSRPARGHALLHVVAQLAELLALGSDACLVLGCRALGRLVTLLGLARSALLHGQLAIDAFSRDCEAKLRNEGAGLGARDQASQVGHRAATHAIGLQSACQLIQECLGLVGTGPQQHAGSGALLRQHLVWKDQVTTTARSFGTAGCRVWRARLTRYVLWLY